MIVGCMVVRDELDLMEMNVRWHLSQGIDEIIVTDNGSVDGTRRLLEELPVTVIDEFEYTFEQAKWATAMAYQARDMGADWIVHIDADQFYWSEAPLSDLLDAHPYDLATVEMVVWLADGRKRMPLGQPSVPIPMGLAKITIHRAAETMRVHRGASRISGTFETGGPLEGAELFHWPFRSRAQAKAKIERAGWLYRQFPQIESDFRSHKMLQMRWLEEGDWDELYDKYVADNPDAVEDDRLSHIMAMV